METQRWRKAVTPKFLESWNCKFYSFFMPHFVATNLSPFSLSFFWGIDPKRADVYPIQILASQAHLKPHFFILSVILLLLNLKMGVWTFIPVLHKTSVQPFAAAALLSFNYFETAIKHLWAPLTTRNSWVTGILFLFSKRVVQKQNHRPEWFLGVETWGRRYSVQSLYV